MVRYSMHLMAPVLVAKWKKHTEYELGFGSNNIPDDLGNLQLLFTKPDTVKVSTSSMSVK